MHTQVAQTSIQTYREIGKDGTISARQRQIMAVIADYPADYSLQELCELTGLPINVVSGRVNELRVKLGELQHGPSRKCRITGRPIKPVRRPHPQGALF